MADDREKKLQRYLKLKKQKEELRKELERIKKQAGAFFFKPYEWQRRFVEALRSYNVAISASSNKRGKTAIGSNVVISWALGYEPWNQIEKGSPDGVEVRGRWYRKSSLGIDPPVDIIITGEDWKLHIGKTIVKELKRWAPPGEYETKKNEQGVEYYWTWNNGSTFTIMCYSQDDDLFESFRAQAAWLDEPAPKKKFDGIARGLLLDRGKIIMTMTPLKEPWILDELILSGRKDVYIDEGNILDNEALYREEVELLKQLKLSDHQIQRYFDLILYDDKEKQKPVSDKGYRAEEFLRQNVPEELHDGIYKLKILKFIREIDPVEVPPRVFGRFKSLIGRVLKEFDTNIHWIEPFEVPTDWPVVAMIDFHLSKPQAISYWAVSPQDIHFCVDEKWENLSAEEIADDIIRKVKTKAWNIKDAFIDPLSKGDTAYIKNRAGDVRDSFSIIYEKLAPHGITLQVASKDKVSGIKNIQSRLLGINGIPTAYIFNTCERHLYEVMRWVYDDEGKPCKNCDDHFMENWYRFTLSGITYEQYQIKPVVDHRPTYEAAWMAA